MPGLPGGGGPPPAPMQGPGLPGGPPDPVLAGLAMLQQSPPPEGEQEALRDASTKIGMAMSRVQTRSPKAARLLADALSKVQQAREALQQEAQKQLPAPPDLGLSGGSMAGGMPGGGGMGPF